MRNFIAMEKEPLNLWEGCKDCDTIEGVKTQLSRVLVNRTSLFYDKPHYSSNEACEYLKISKKTLDNLCSANEIAYFQPRGKRYFMKEDLDAYIKKNRHRAKYS